MKEKINPKSYVLIKYLFTLAMMLMYSIGILALVTAIMKQNNQTDRWLINNYLKLTTIFIALSLLFASIYLSLRIYIHKKTGYKYKPTELKKIYLNIGLFCGAILVSIYLIVSSITPVKVFFITSLIFNIVLMGFGFVISILEELSLSFEKLTVVKSWRENDTSEKNAKDESKKSEPTEIIFKKKKDKENPFMEE